MQIFLSEEVHDMMDSKDEIRGLLAKHRRYLKPAKVKARDVQLALAAFEEQHDPFRGGQMGLEGVICAGSLLAQMKQFKHDHGASGDRYLVALIDVLLDEPVETFVKRTYGLVESDCTAASRIDAAVAKRLAQLGCSAQIAAE